MSLAEKELGSRNQEPIEYVERAFSEVAEFEQSRPSSPNILIDVLSKGGSPVHYYARKSVQALHDLYNSYTKRPYGYVLHN